MTREHFGAEILKRFKPKDVIGYSVGDFDQSSIELLTADVKQWWALYKQWESTDTIAAAYAEQRLTVKGTSTLDVAIGAQDPNAWGEVKTFDKPKPGNPKFAQFEPTVQYPIKKTNQSIVDRLSPENFVPANGGGSLKTDLGLHDLSAGLMNPKAKLSEQQYKTITPYQIYAFMPVSHAVDQAVFQNLNFLAKSIRENNPDFYNLIRDMRARMTRIKLAAEHDMATSFIHVGATATGRPRFKFSLLEKTDVSLRDKASKLVGDDVDFKDSKVIQQPTTPKILAARHHAAINFQKLVLGEMLRYGEVTVAYRQHAAGFPVFAKFDKASSSWKEYTIPKAGWRTNVVKLSFSDGPALGA